MRRNNEHPSAASRHLPQGGENPHPLSKILLELSEFLPPWGECPPAVYFFRIHVTVYIFEFINFYHDNYRKAVINK
jgi:hypothetical protein